MSVYTDEWIPNDFISMNPNISIEINNVIKLKNILGEAFWIIVTKILPENKYIGQVNNHLILNSPYNYEDLVLFTKADIRDYKNKQIQIEQIQTINNIIQQIKEIIGRTPTIEEVDLFLTKLTHKS